MPTIKRVLVILPLFSPKIRPMKRISLLSVTNVAIFAGVGLVILRGAACSTRREFRADRGGANLAGAGSTIGGDNLPPRMRARAPGWAPDHRPGIRA
jgi:Zn-dependent protease with chaperone function